MFQLLGKTETIELHRKFEIEASAKGLPVNLTPLGNYADPTAMALWRQFQIDAAKEAATRSEQETKELDEYIAHSHQGFVHKLAVTGEDK